MAVRHYLSPEDHQVVKELLQKHGLRPLADSMGAAARELLESGECVKDEWGDKMFEGDIETAAANLSGDLY